MKHWYIQDALRMTPLETSAELNALELRAWNVETLLRERLHLVEELLSAVEASKVYLQWRQVSPQEAICKHLESVLCSYRKHASKNLDKQHGETRIPTDPLSKDSGLKLLVGSNPALSAPLSTGSTVTALASYGAHQQEGESSLPVADLDSSTKSKSPVSANVPELEVRILPESTNLSSSPDGRAVSEKGSEGEVPYKAISETEVSGLARNKGEHRWFGGNQVTTESASDSHTLIGQQTGAKYHNEERGLEPSPRSSSENQASPTQFNLIGGELAPSNGNANGISYPDQFNLGSPDQGTTSGNAAGTSLPKASVGETPTGPSLSPALTITDEKRKDDSGTVCPPRMSKEVNATAITEKADLPGDRFGHMSMIED